MCGPLRTGRDAVEKLSNNTAELRAVIEALRYTYTANSSGCVCATAMDRPTRAQQRVMNV